MRSSFTPHSFLWESIIFCPTMTFDILDSANVPFSSPLRWRKLFSLIQKLILFAVFWGDVFVISGRYGHHLLSY